MFSFLSDLLSFAREELARAASRATGGIRRKLRSAFPPDAALLAARGDTELLAEMLHHRRPEVRRRALDALDSLGTPAALIALAQVVARGDPRELFEPALGALRRRDGDAASAIRNAHLYGRAYRQEAARFSDVSAWDADPFIVVLARIGTPAALDALEIEADDLRQDVTPRLRVLGAGEYDVLVEMLLRGRLAVAQQRVIERLAARGESRAIEPLLAAYRRADDTHLTRRYALDAIHALLSKAPAEVPVPLLTELAQLKGLRVFDLGTNRSYSLDTGAVRDRARTELERRGRPAGP